MCLHFDLSGDNIQKTVTELLDEWQAMQHLYFLVVDFAFTQTLLMSRGLNLFCKKLFEGLHLQRGWWKLTNICSRITLFRKRNSDRSETIRVLKIKRNFFLFFICHQTTLPKVTKMHETGSA